jgi:hypothetical protein
VNQRAAEVEERERSAAPPPPTPANVTAQPAARLAVGNRAAAELLGPSQTASASPEPARLAAVPGIQTLLGNAAVAHLATPASPPELDTGPTGAAQRVIEVLTRQQEVAGVGDFPAAFAILDGLPTPELVATLNNLDRQGYLDVLIGNANSERVTEHRVLDLAASIRAIRQAAPEPPQLQAERQLAVINATQRQTELFHDVVRELTTVVSTTPEKVAVKVVRALRTPMNEVRARLVELRDSLLAQNADQAGRIDTMIINFDVLWRDVDKAEEQARQFLNSTSPEMTAGELYWGHIEQQELYLKRNQEAGGTGYAWAVLNAAEWLSANLLYAASELATSNTMGLEARNALMYRTGHISYEAYTENIRWNIRHGLLNLAITAATMGWGSAATGGEAILSTAVTRDIAGGLVESASSDLFNMIAAEVSDVPDVQNYHWQMVAGPTGWVEAALLEGLSGGVCGWAGTKIRPGMRPTGLAGTLEQGTATESALLRAQPSEISLLVLPEPVPLAKTTPEVWVNRSPNSRLFHPPGSPWYKRIEADPNRGPHWQKIPTGQAVDEGFAEARWNPRLQRRLGAQREADFIQDYIHGRGRKQYFGAPADPLAVHEQVTVYHRVVQGGTEYYVEFKGLASGTREIGRRLDVVDLTDPASPKALEIGTATPSASETRRKESQLNVWHEAAEEASHLARSAGGDGRVWGRLRNGKYVDLTGLTYYEILMP